MLTNESELREQIAIWRKLADALEFALDGPLPPLCLECEARLMGGHNLTQCDRHRAVAEGLVKHPQ